MINVAQFGFAQMIQDMTIQIMNGKSQFSKPVRQLTRNPDITGSIGPF